ncbi:putative gibberellin 20 oxidase [Cercophora newfieldiana]|uniref:Gibberellin 20 oxidase n=1 Tax=Cercophora newfieldiana TaxID=92897 RepID=A0AA39XZW4_9PEZI|nr:putative gibberellin 20 oxidase [Cercophora newfieldiana]
MPISISIPVIDISGYLSSDPVETKRVAAAIRSAAIAPGFFQVVGHPITLDLRQRLIAAVKQFYSLPREAKNKLHRNNSTCLRGYESVGEQTLEEGYRDAKEGFMIGQELSGEGLRFAQGPNQWPSEEECPGFREVSMEYFEAMRLFSRTMFRIVALSLDLEEKYFDEFAYGSNTVTMCRAHRYPPTTPEMAGKSRGIGAHTDFGALTLLLQDDIGGLEVFHRPSETWHPVHPVKDAYVVNIGDMTERWTNDKYTSTLHRVISPVSERERYSIAFFNEGLLDQVIECIPTCLGEGEKPKYEPIKVEDHLKKRYGNSY